MTKHLALRGGIPGLLRRRPLVGRVDQACPSPRFGVEAAAEIAARCSRWQSVPSRVSCQNLLHCVRQAVSVPCRYGILAEPT